MKSFNIKTFIHNNYTSITIDENNHKIYSIDANVILNQPSIPHTLINNIYNLSLTIHNDISKLYFKRIRITYKSITLNLINIINKNLKDKLSTPVLQHNAYDFIQPSFLPSFTDNIDLQIYNNTKRITCAVKLLTEIKQFNKTNISVSIIKIINNHFFELNPKFIIPIFNNTIKCSIICSDHSVLPSLIKKLELLNIKIIIK